jgi:hypothetical protein
MFAKILRIEVQSRSDWRDQRERAILHFPEGFRGGGVGGEKRFEREFGECDVHWRTKNRGSAEEGEKARFGDQLERHDYSCVVAIYNRGTSRFALAGSWIFAKLVHELHENWVGGDLNLMMQPCEQMRTPFGQIGDARRQARGMQADTKHVDRRLQQDWGRTDEKRSHRAIGGDQHPMAINGECGIRLMPPENQIDGLARVLQRGVGKLAFRKDRGESRRDQENVAFAQRHIELCGEVENHLPTWLRAPGFQKTQVARGDFRLAGEIELAQAAALAPFAQKLADGLCGCRHQATIA